MCGAFVVLLTALIRVILHLGSTKVHGIDDDVGRLGGGRGGSGRGGSPNVGSGERRVYALIHLDLECHGMMLPHARTHIEYFKSRRNLDARADEVGVGIRMIQLSILPHPRARPKVHAGTVKDVPLIAERSALFEIVLPVGLYDRHPVMFLGPIDISRYALGVVTGIVVDVIDIDTGLGQILLEECAVLLILDQEIFLHVGRIDVRQNAIGQGGGRQGIISGRGDDFGFGPSQAEFGPRRHHGGVVLISGVAPRIAHEAGGADAVSAGAVVEIGEAEEVSGFVTDDSDASDFAPARVPERGRDVIILH
mmetsp:Transcript_26737/g.78990  ORF Transcript_26737/g.78990 Transcript_26737/m.78990 type:complete len:308 (-) Transcript_26737:541-1464(-)